MEENQGKFRVFEEEIERFQGIFETFKGFSEEFAGKELQYRLVIGLLAEKMQRKAGNPEEIAVLAKKIDEIRGKTLFSREIPSFPRDEFKNIRILKKKFEILNTKF